VPAGYDLDLDLDLDLHSWTAARSEPSNKTGLSDQYPTRFVLSVLYMLVTSFQSQSSDSLTNGDGEAWHKSVKGDMVLLGK
jgi:hypothetical protein